MRLDPEQAGHDRQSLASALRDLRRASGLSGERLARRCHLSQSKVSRIENGRLLPSVVDVDRILRALGVDQATSAELLALARVANAEYQDIRASVRRGLHHRQRELAALEADAREMRHFLPALITGLLQTPEYMRAAMDTPVEPAAGDTATAIALKLERQAVLYDKSKRFEFLLTESALRWQLCEPSVMAVQLDRLVSLSLLPNIRIGVLPLSTQIADGPYHAFVIYDDHIVTIELSGAKDSAARLPGSLHRLLVRPALLPKRLRRVAREHVVGAAERGPGAAVGAEAVVADLAHPGPRTWRKDRQWREWYS